MSTKSIYVAILLLSTDCSRVALILKNKPAFLAGKLCSIGGRAEPGEDLAAAARREMLEEAGVEVEIAGLLETTHAPDGSWDCHFFVAFDDAAVAAARSMEEEQVGIYDTASLPPNVAPEVPDLIDRARDLWSIACAGA